MQPNHSIQAIIFDWAGTMIDFGSRAPAAVFEEVFRLAGLEIEPTIVRQFMGMAKREHIAAILQTGDVKFRWQQKYGNEPTDLDTEKLYQQFLPLQKQILAQHCDLIPGALDTFRWCREQNIHVGSSTGYTRELMNVVVPIATNAGYDPAVVLTADDAPAGRPAPWLIFECAKRLNVYPLRRIIKVDDTTVGIEAGVNAGTWTVGVTRTGNLIGMSERELSATAPEIRQRLLNEAAEKMKLAGADFVIESVAELPAIVTAINQRS